jgi:glycosyltransferase involved in cell wall biosynthesis
MSNVVLEAMASGLPVVCADLPGHREVFTPGSEGVVVSPCDAQTLGDALAGLAEEAERCLALGAAARGRVLARFNLRRMISDYERLYERFAQAEEIEAVAAGVERG